MQRTKPPSSLKIMIDYYDKNQARRWGELVKETRKTVTVRTSYGEKETINKDRIVERREITNA